MNLRQAERKQARIRMGLQGPSGSGKTFGALQIAYGLCGNWKKICVIDSEHNAADLYAHMGPFNVLGIGVPFSPESFSEAIKLAENAGMDVIIIDSISHEWEGQGGILDIHSSMAGNSFTNWNKITPRHNQFVQTMLQSPAHIIATIRTKQDYVLNDRNGKKVPEKVGLKGITRDGMDYEFTLALDIDMKHYAVASKDRTGLFMDKPPFKLSADTGITINEWCNVKEDISEIIKRIRISMDRDVLKEYWDNYKKYPEVISAVGNRMEQLKSREPVSFLQ